jgi:hypothetical protein
MNRAAKKINEPLAQVELAANAVKVMGKDHAKARAELREAVERARRTHTLAEIGETLGMTRQGVYDLCKR